MKPSRNKTLKASGLSLSFSSVMLQNMPGWRWGLWAALAVCLLFVGCDDGPAKDKRVVKVGVLHSQTGTMADSEKPVIDATLMAIDVVNQQGLIPGVRIEAVVADGGSDPQTFARRAGELIRDEGVVAIFGCWTSASRKAVKPVVEKYKSLLFYPVQYEGIETSPNIVYLGAAPNQQIIPAIYWAKDTLGAERMYLVGSDYVFPRAAHEIIKAQLKAFGMKPAGEAYIPLGSSDVEAVVQEIVDTQPDIIVNTLNGSTNKAFFQALRDAGITSDKIPTLSFSIGENELQKIGLRNMTGDYAAWNYFQSIDTPMNKTWVADFKKRYGENRVTADAMEAAWNGVFLWALSARDAMLGGSKGLLAPACEPGRVADHIPNQSHLGPSGLVFIHPENQHLYKTARIGQIEPDGQFRILWSSDVAVQPQPYPIFRSEEGWRQYLNNLNRSWGGSWTAPKEQP